MADFFIRRPIVAMVIAILTVIVGLITLKRLPISEYPTVSPCRGHNTGSPCTSPCLHKRNARSEATTLRIPKKETGRELKGMVQNSGIPHGFLGSGFSIG